MKEAVIVSAVRTAVGKAPKGTLKNSRPDDLGAAAIKGAVERVEGLNINEIDDVIMGCAFPEAEQGMNVARTSAIEAGLPVEVSAMTVNRYCSSGLQTIALAADELKRAARNIIVAGGLETMSMIPMGGNVVRPNPKIVDTYPDYYLNMGLTAENLAKKYEITREQADEFFSVRIRKRRRRSKKDDSKTRSCRSPCALTKLTKAVACARRKSFSTPTKACAMTRIWKALQNFVPFFTSKEL